MTREEKLKLLLDTGEYDFIKSIPKENMRKLIFALAYIEDTIPMSDIDGIKAEIRTEISDYEGYADFHEGIRFGLRTALEIIDKHIGEKSKTGHWIDIDEWREIVDGFEQWGYFHKCSRCGYVFKFLEIDNYCPNCGAKMVEPQESEVEE